MIWRLEELPLITPTYPVSQPKGLGRSELMCFLRVCAILPMRRDWRVLTRRVRQVQSMRRERTRRMSPVVVSFSPH